eukprot:TRINITY_DN5449_c0_g1_i2.p1 TRINITY_DN5449_c0_g1~~TRINITY_DN5449_c0_g1_i2.p1  ORF type:complete len:285 (-),score=28.02 TRINITY_DN5449_c0_g1_i2:15-869(-)
MPSCTRKVCPPAEDENKATNRLYQSLPEAGFKSLDGPTLLVPGRAGAMAEESVVDEHLCTLKPASISHAQAAGLLVGFNTAYHGLVQRGDLKAGETLLVTGAAGGMGLAAVELGKLLGATVIAAASSEEKLQLARQAGASETVNYSNLKDFKDQVMTKTGGRGVDVVYEVVGGEVFTQCTRVMAPLGRLLVVGFASGTIPTIPANIPLIKGFSVVGVRAGAEMRRNPAFALEMNKKVQEWGAEGKLSPLVTQVNASGWKQLFTAMADRKVVGKAVVVWEETAKL